MDTQRSPDGPIPFKVDAHWQSTAAIPPLAILPVPQELPAHMHTDWLAMLNLAEAPPFQRPEWFSAYCRADPRRRCLLLTHAPHGALSALLPVEIRTPWTAEIPAPLSPVPPPLLVLGDGAEAFWPALAGWLRRGPIAMLGLGRYDAARMQALVAQATGHGLTPIIHPVGPVISLALPPTWEEYLAALSKPHRYKVRHAESEIAEHFPQAEYRIWAEGACSQAAIDDLIRLNRLRFAGGRTRSYLADPQFAAFYRHAMTWVLAQGYGVMFTLRIAGRTVAVVGAIHLPGQAQAYYHMVGRDPQALPRTFSPGMALACHVIRWTIARGAQSLCLGQGALPYKHYLGGTETPLHEVQIARSPRAAAILGVVDPALRRADLALGARLAAARGMR